MIRYWIMDIIVEYSKQLIVHNVHMSNDSKNSIEIPIISLNLVAVLSSMVTWDGKLAVM